MNSRQEQGLCSNKINMLISKHDKQKPNFVMHVDVQGSFDKKQMHREGTADQTVSTQA